MIDTVAHAGESPDVVQPYADLGLEAGHCPVSEAVQAEIVTLPLYPELRDADQEKIIEAATAYLRQR